MASSPLVARGFLEVPLVLSYDMMFDEITASSLVKIDANGNPVVPTAHPVNPAGFTIHSALHMTRSDAQAVMHLHTPHGQAVSAMADGLLPHTQTAMSILHDLAYHDYEGIATNLEEQERLVADINTKNAIILRNHGTLAVGASVAECFLRLYFLERACEAQVMMLSAGHDGLHTPPQGTPQKVAHQTEAQSVAIHGRTETRMARAAAQTGQTGYIVQSLDNQLFNTVRGDDHQRILIA